jgi:hypothetical protein
MHSFRWSTLLGFPDASGALHRTHLFGQFKRILIKKTGLNRIRSESALAFDSALLIAPRIVPQPGDRYRMSPEPPCRYGIFRRNDAGQSEVPTPVI